MRSLPALLASLSLLTACAAAPPAPPVTSPPAPPPTATPAASACPGTIEAHDGLQEVSDEALLKQALGAPGKGSLCTGKVFEAKKAVTVYRVWNKAKAYTQLGRWWSFSRPSGPVDAYRAANAICPEWSALDVVSECTLKQGARVVVGPGQSATCEKGAFPASATNQVFVPNETRDPAAQKVFVEACTPGAAWP